jgi:hypothetical protein
MLFLLACKNDASLPVNDELKKNESVFQDVNADMSLFSLTFNKALVNEDVRIFLKEEALKKFDGDYDILYQNVKNLKLKSGKTFEETLLSGCSSHLM